MVRRVLAKSAEFGLKLQNSRFLGCDQRNSQNRQDILPHDLSAYDGIIFYNISISQEIKENGIYQAFFGVSLIDRWQCPHASKVQEFRSRLSQDTQMKLNDRIVQLAVEMGFGIPKDMDIDSTVQEANISYPSDARLLLKLAEKCQKLKDIFKLKIGFDLKTIRSFYQRYFFAPKNKPLEEKRRIFREYYLKVKYMAQPLIKRAENRALKKIRGLRWNTKLFLKQVAFHGRKYINDVGYFVKTHEIRKGKILAFHAFKVACIRKRKVGKENEFGRVFQLARIGCSCCRRDGS